MRPKRSQAISRMQGAKARHVGRTLEAYVQSSCDYYARSGLGLFTKGHPEVGGKPGEMYFARKSKVDYQGTAVGRVLDVEQVPLLTQGTCDPIVVTTPNQHWRPVTVAVAFDVKSVADRASFSVDDRDRHQTEFLLAHRSFHEKHGLPHLTGYLLIDQKRRRAWWCTDLKRLYTGSAVPFRVQRGEGDFCPSLPILSNNLMLPPVPFLDFSPEVRLYDTARTHRPALEGVRGTDPNRVLGEPA